MFTLKVLAVDREAENREEIRQTLYDFVVNFPFSSESFDFKTLQAATGEQAIEIIDSHKPDILLLSHGLPKMRGIEVLKYIHQNHIAAEVIMITSHASLQLAAQAVNEGAFDFIVKPFSSLELKTSIEKVAKRVYLNKVRKNMKSAGKEVRFQFLSVLSHELKAPLNAIEGYLNMMKDGQLGDKIEDYDKPITRSIERVKGMRNLILDLLDLTKIETRKERKTEKVNLTEVAQMAIDTMNPYSIQKEITVTLQCPDYIVYEADRTEMEIIFNNLISNAIKYNRDGGKVDIEIRKTNNKVRVTVADTGIGMTDEEMKKLFQEFVRIKNKKTKKISGSGLGLSIMKKIVEIYKGDVAVESEPDKGSTFIVHLPLDGKA